MGSRSQSKEDSLEQADAYANVRAKSHLVTDSSARTASRAGRVGFELKSHRLIQCHQHLSCRVGVTPTRGQLCPASVGPLLSKQAITSLLQGRFVCSGIVPGEDGLQTRPHLLIDVATTGDNSGREPWRKRCHCRCSWQCGQSCSPLSTLRCKPAVFVGGESYTISFPPGPLSPSGWTPLL